MTFGDLKIEKGEFYVKKAINRGRKEGVRLKIKNREKKIKITALEEIRRAKDSIYEDLDIVEKNFPNINELDEFYKELIEIKIGIKKLKENIGKVNWTKRKVVQLHKDYKNRIIRSKNKKMIDKGQKGYYGRIKSLMNKLEKELKFLEDGRRKIKEIPNIKTGIKTACITGFPNVGKSTLLKKLTKADVEIKPYAFTTKDIMMGYIEKKMQLIDTPGTLNRLERMNDIEKIAHTAMKHLRGIIIYVFDITETCGYTLKQQTELFEKIEKEIKKDIIIFLSKRDLIKQERISIFRALHNKYKVFDDAEKLKDYMITP